MQPWVAECPLPAASDDAEHTGHRLFAAVYSTEKQNLAAPIGLDSAADATGIDTEINRELNVDRLTKIERHWWLIGRPQPPRPLHRQVAMGRDPIIDEQMDMHLVWNTGRIYLKPLPRFILCDRFWDRYLTCQNTGCSCSAPTLGSLSPNNTASTRAGLLAPSRSNREKNRPQTHCLRGVNRRLALGFLVSYLALIRHESDFAIALDKGLIPKEVTWPAWHALSRRILDTSSTRTEGEIYQHVDKRFIYGDLRLSRLNKVYRLTLREPLRGYVFSDQRYVDFWRRNLGTLTSTLAYMVIVLTAMQVGLATTELGDSVAFGRASSGFAVFCILAPLVAVGVLIVYFCFLFVNNWRSTTAYQRKRERAIWPSV